MFIPHEVLEEKLLQILAEDVGQGDITTLLVVPPCTYVRAKVTAKQTGIAAGVEETQVLLQRLGLEVETLTRDGKKVKPNQVLLRISGDARTILAAERTLLNILSRMSGIATITRTLVDTLRKAKLKTRIACTRKTAPGLMYFDKKAVYLGGGDTHRLHLDDMVLIKDNHLAVTGSIEKTVRTARAHASFGKKIEVEVAKVGDIVPAIEAGADIVMLDNFSPKQIEEAVKLLIKMKLYGKVLLEASGGITAKNVVEYASTGVNVVSLGEITQSPRALDLSLEITK